MRWVRALAIAALASVMVLAGTAAHATTHYWNNTQVIGSRYVKVRYCAGRGTAKLQPGTITGRNVCAVWVPYNFTIHAYVRETGTKLLNTTYCGMKDGVWVTLTDKTDTRRHAYAWRTEAEWCT